MRRPFGCDPTIFGEVTPDRVEIWVRCRTNRSRVRNTRPAACCCSLFTATNCMLGRCAASQIASASIASFFCHSQTALHRRAGSAELHGQAGRAGEPSDALHHTPPALPCTWDGLGCKEVQKLSSTDPLAKYRSTPLIRSVNVKDVLGDIQTDYDNFRRGRLPQVVLNTSTLAHRCRRGRPPHHKPPCRL